MSMLPPPKPASTGLPGFVPWQRGAELECLQSRFVQSAAGRLALCPDPHHAAADLRGRPARFGFALA